MNITPDNDSDTTRERRFPLFAAAAAAAVVIVGLVAFVRRDDTDAATIDSATIEAANQTEQPEPSVDGIPDAGTDEALQQESGTAQFVVGEGPDVTYVTESCVLDSGSLMARLSDGQSGDVIDVSETTITTSTPSTAGTAQVSVDDAIATVTGTLENRGEYKLTIFGCDNAPPTGDGEVARGVIEFEAGASSASISGSVEDFSVDVWTFVAAEGQTVSLDVSFANATDLLGGWVVWAPNGDTVVIGADGITPVELPADGTYQLRFLRARAQAEGSFDYSAAIT